MAEVQFTDACVRAIQSAATHLEIDELVFARSLGGAEIAYLALELRAVRYHMMGRDRERVDELLRKIGAMA